MIDAGARLLPESKSTHRYYAFSRADTPKEMKTIGSRLTFLYVCLVAGTILSIFFLGRLLVARQVRDGIDSILTTKFSELSERLSRDLETGSRDLQGLLPQAGSGMPFYVELEDRWNDSAFREARLRGESNPEQRTPVFFSSTHGNHEAVRIVEGKDDSLVIRIATPEKPIAQALHTYDRIGLPIMGGMLLVGVFGGRLVSRAALRPIKAIQSTAMRISSENLSERIPVVQGVQEELSSLSQLLNNTFDRLESSFEQIKHFSADASHEMKTPLSLIRLNVERLVGKEHLSDEGKDILQDTLEEIHRLNKLIEKLLFLSRAEAGEVELNLEKQDPREFIRSFSHDAQALVESSGVLYSEAANDPGSVAFDGSYLRRVLFNLISNPLPPTSTAGNSVFPSEFSNRPCPLSFPANAL